MKHMGCIATVIGTVIASRPFGWGLTDIIEVEHIVIVVVVGEHCHVFHGHFHFP